MAALLFAIGLAGALTRRNAILVLIGIELMLNAANLNLIAFWRYGPHPEALTGMMFAIFSIAVAAAEAAVGLGLVISDLSPRQDNGPGPDEQDEGVSGLMQETISSHFRRHDRCAHRARILWLIPAVPIVAAGVIALLKQPRRKTAAALAIGSLSAFAAAFAGCICAVVGRLG